MRTDPVSMDLRPIIDRYGYSAVLGALAAMNSKHAVWITGIGWALEPCPETCADREPEGYPVQPDCPNCEGEGAAFDGGPCPHCIAIGQAQRSGVSQ